MLLQGIELSLGTASVKLQGIKPVWQKNGSNTDVNAGSGIAATITDLVLGKATVNDFKKMPPSELSSLGSRERSIPVDQTHTSVIVDERWVVKIVSALGASDRSASILEILKEAHSTVTPDLAGTLQWEHPDYGTGTLALVTEYVPNSSDGWTWAVDDVLEYLATSDEDPTPPVWPSVLGEITAKMHSALLAPALTPGESDPRDNDRNQAKEVFERMFAIIDNDEAAQNSAAFNDEDFLQRMRSRKSAIAAELAKIPETSKTPLVIPHGDYHVGQLLRTEDGRYLVLDLDGDPQWCPERRMRPDGASRDVAHMLVSIDIVAAVTQRRLGHADKRAWDWAQQAKEQFLNTYNRHADKEFLDEKTLEGLVAEQLMNELSYAENFLPRWRYTSDGVITHRYPKTDPNTMEEPWNPLVSPTT